MISVNEALALIESNSINLGEELISLQKCGSRILAEGFYADRALPPYNRATMDGIAVNYNGYLKANGKLKVSGVAPAGAPQAKLEKPEDCLEVMTGAVVPQGCDTVIRYEDIDIKDGYAHILVDNIVKGKNIHEKGSDIKKDALLLESGSRIRGQEIGIAASIGKHQVQVKKNPRTMILSTGDELVDIHETPLSHQIRRSNSYAISSLLSYWSIQSDQLHLGDDEKLIRENLSDTITNYDLLILSGGVSKGKFDFVPKALKDIGVRQIFHKVLQRPGKPLWFGRKDNTIVFGLPGNPVSSFVCARKYIFHWLEKSLSVKAGPSMMAQLATDFRFKPDLHYFLPVTVSSNNLGILQAQVFQGNGSGDFVNLKDANAFMELPQGKEMFQAGEAYPILML